MQEISSLIGIAVALTLGAVSPGPSFVMIARTAASSNRTNGVSAAIGMGIGGFLFATLSVVGLLDLLQAVPTLYLTMKIVGGVYLAYLGFRIWRGAGKPLIVTHDSASKNDSAWRYFVLGLATQLSNPKTAIVYASVFAAFLPVTPSIQFKLSVVVLVFVIEAGWYSLVATVLSTETSRNNYLRYKTWIDRAAGGVMIALGIRLAASANR